MPRRFNENGTCLFTRPAPVDNADFCWERARAVQCFGGKHYGVGSESEERAFFTQKAAEAVIELFSDTTAPKSPLLEALHNAVDVALNEDSHSALTSLLKIVSVRYTQLKPAPDAPYQTRDPPRNEARYVPVTAFETFNVKGEDGKIIQYVQAPESEVRTGSGSVASQSLSVLSSSAHPSQAPHSSASTDANSSALSTGPSFATTSHPANEQTTSHLLSAQSSQVSHASFPSRFLPASHLWCFRCSCSNSFCSSSMRRLQCCFVCP